MQYPDGSGRVAHKVSTRNFGGFIMPENEHDERFFVPWSSAATADFVAMTAMAARIFRPYDPQYAEKCINAAKVSYEFLKNNPANVLQTRVDSQQENMPLSVMQMTDCGRRLKCGRPWR